MKKNVMLKGTSAQKRFSSIIYVCVIMHERKKRAEDEKAKYKITEIQYVLHDDDDNNPFMNSCVI